MYFCNRCGINFTPYRNEWDLLENQLCKNCIPTRFSSKSRKSLDHFCIKCGLVLEKRERKTRVGNIIFISSHLKYCEPCKKLINQPSPPTPRQCVVCGETIGKFAKKYCDDHNTPKKRGENVKINPATNRQSSIKWQKENPEKVKIQRLSKYNSHLLNVLYECRCESDQKHNHHFDYSRPYEVIRLCPGCHAAEHRRIRRVSN